MNKINEKGEYIIEYPWERTEPNVYSASDPTSTSTKTLESGKDSPDSIEVIQGGPLGYSVKYFFYTTSREGDQSTLSLEGDSNFSLKRQLGGLNDTTKDMLKPPDQSAPTIRHDPNYDYMTSTTSSSTYTNTLSQDSTLSSGRKKAGLHRLGDPEEANRENDLFYTISYPSPDIEDIYSVEPGTLSPVSITLGPPELPVCLAKGKIYSDAGQI
ncbi:hypothetical protein TRVA0_003S03466 [Trichomonascus vanleenenianus]|uniref:uncharacterized protein n=1 Tax=Trichomonascus vanleenenianus TaxID=2268995 RepID=UPI003ECA1D0D